MNADILGFVVSAVHLAEYGCRFAAAGDEIEAFRELFDGTTALLSHTKASLSKLSAFLTTETKKRIDDEISRTEPALDRARTIIPTTCSDGSNGKRIGWVFKDKDAAQAHKDVLAQRHTTLVGMSIELALTNAMRNLRPTNILLPSSRMLDLLAMRHTTYPP